MAFLQASAQADKLTKRRTLAHIQLMNKEAAGEEARRRRRAACTPTLGLSIASTAGGRVSTSAGLMSTLSREPTTAVTALTSGGWPPLTTPMSATPTTATTTLPDAKAARDALTKCPLCNESYRDPRVLACFHSFCKECLEKQLSNNERIVCPQCERGCASCALRQPPFFRLW